jgi:hypothetical protein
MVPCSIKCMPLVCALCRLHGPWPASILANTTLLAFEIGATTVRQRFCSGFTNVTDHCLEAFYRTQLAQQQALVLKRHETIAGLLKLLSTMQANCWLDPSVTCSMLKRLKDISDVAAELTACKSHLSQVHEAQQCLEPILDVAQVRSITSDCNQRALHIFGLP